MAKDPAFLFYTNDFLTGVAELTMEERGQYITLMCLQHQKGSLTKKLIMINVPGVTKDVLGKFKKNGEGNLFNERLKKEIIKRQEHAEKQRKRALDGWKKRKATADATALPLENEDVNENRNINESNNKIPPLSEFLEYAISRDYKINTKAVELKYHSWIENNWMTGGKNPRHIINWKNTLLNTMPHLVSVDNSKVDSAILLQQDYGIHK